MNVKIVGVHNHHPLFNIDNTNSKSNIQNSTFIKYIAHMLKSRFIIFFSLFTFIVNAQEKPITGTLNKKADKLFNQALENFTLQNFSEAILLCNKAIQADNKYIDAHMLLADLYEGEEQEIKAQELYHQLIKVNPNFPISYLGLANYMYENANYDPSTYSRFANTFIYPKFRR